MAKLAPDRLLRELKDDAELLNEIVRTLPDSDADADENTIRSALHLVRGAVLLLEELLEEKKSDAQTAVYAE